MNLQTLTKIIDGVFHLTFGNPKTSQTPPQKEQIMNETEIKGWLCADPGKILEVITRAIQHRTISSTGCWYIIFYDERICCVPTNVNVPPEIILGQFNDYQAKVGFSPKDRDGINEYAVNFFKELYK